MHGFAGIEEIFNSLQFQVGLGARLITRGDRFLIPGIGSIAQETRVLWDEEVTTFRFMPRRAGHLASRRGRRRRALCAQSVKSKVLLTQSDITSNIHRCADAVWFAK